MLGTRVGVAFIGREGRTPQSETLKRSPGKRAKGKNAEMLALLSWKRRAGGADGMVSSSASLRFQTATMSTYYFENGN